MCHDACLNSCKLLQTQATSSTDNCSITLVIYLQKALQKKLPKTSAVVYMSDCSEEESTPEDDDDDDSDWHETPYIRRARQAIRKAHREADAGKVNKVRTSIVQL